jgi:hypothetical protein
MPAETSAAPIPSADEPRTHCALLLGREVEHVFPLADDYALEIFTRMSADRRAQGQNVRMVRITEAEAAYYRARLDEISAALDRVVESLVDLGLGFSDERRAREWLSIQSPRHPRYEEVRGLLRLWQRVWEGFRLVHFAR